MQSRRRQAPPHKWLVLAVVWEIVLVAGLIQIPSIREAFGIHLPSVRDLGTILGFGFIVFLSMEILKAVLRKTMVPRKDAQDGRDPS